MSKYLFENSACLQLNEDGRDRIKSKIINQKCVICGSDVFLLSMTDGDSIACTKSPFDHKTSWMIDCNKMEIVLQVTMQYYSQR